MTYLAELKWAYRQLAKEKKRTNHSALRYSVIERRMEKIKLEALAAQRVDDAMRERRM